MRKPNAVIHMTGYGLIYGLLLGMLYMWGFFILAGTAEGANWGAMFGTAYFALIFGGLPGAIMGFIEGWILWFLTRDLQLPLPMDVFTEKRNRGIVIVGGLTFLGMSAVMSLLFGGVFNLFFTLIFILLPATIAGAAAIYATHRYMLKLRAWGSNIEKSKNKAKHTPKNNLAYEDNMSENVLNIPETDAQSRMKQDK